jgi:DNA repair exonuclease SbcCD ATPase subunit/DNA repair exonuclease SbcCD nuclease subunit
MPKPKKILHCGDLHAFQRKRHEEFKTMVDKMCSLIEKENVDLVYVGGDVVDSKARLSPEQIEAVTYFYYKVSSLVPIIGIPGNHDCDLKQKGSLDSLTPIVNNVNPVHPIFYLKDSGVYNLYEIDWCVWSCLDNKHPDFSTAKKESYKIGCFHGSVKGCVTDSNWLMAGSEMSVEDFNECNNAFLNDIHKQQDFRNKEIAYSGSWYQVKIDEEEDKGVLIWEWDENNARYEYTFHKLENENGFRTYEIKDLDSFDITSVSAPSDKFIVRLLYTGNEENYSAIKFNELKKKAKVSLGNEIITQKRFKKKKSASQKKGVIATTTDFFAEYFKRMECDDATIEQLKEIDLIYSKKVDNTDYQIGEYFIDEVEISNFLVYGDESIINFTNLPGLIGLFAPNKSGKSSLLEAITFCLFNKSPKGSVAIKNLINDQAPDNTKAYVQVKLFVNGSLWRIKRSIIPGKTNTKVIIEVYETVDGVEVERHEESRPKTDTGVLRKLLGDEKVFLTTVLSTITNSTEFIDSKNAERLDLIIKFLGISVYDQKHVLCNDEVKEFEKEINSLNKSLEKLTPTNELEESRQEVLSKIKIAEDKVEECKVIIKDYAKRKAEVEQSIKELNIIGVNKTSKELEDELSQNTTSLSKHEVSLTSYTTRKNEILKEWSEKFEAHPIKEYDAQDLNDLLEAINKTTSTLEVEVESLETNLECEVCPTCNQKWLELDREGTESLIESKKTLIQESKNKVKNIKEEVKLAKTLQKEYDIVCTSIELTESKIEIVESKKETLNEQIKIVKDNAHKLEKRNEFEEQLEEIEAELEKQKNLKSAKEQAIALFKKEIQGIDYAIDEYNETVEAIKEQEELIKGMTLYKKAMHRTGIPSLILETFIPAINSEINSQINDLFEINVNFELKDEQLDIIFYYDEFTKNEKGKRDVVQASGMEKTVINLAIRSALNKISLLPKPSFIMLDEVFNTLDKENLEQIKTFLIRLKEQYYNIIIVSHLDEIKDMPEHLIHLEKVNGITTIV